MRLKFTLAAFALAVAMLVGCGAPVTIQTPQGKVAYATDQVVIRVNELQNAAIQANAQGALPEATTRVIVQFAVSADQTLKAAPAGWRATVAAAWRAAKAQLPPTLPPNITSAMQFFDLLLTQEGIQ